MSESELGSMKSFIFNIYNKKDNLHYVKMIM